MAISLKFDSFGYCRQMLQTVSDAKLMGAEYRYEDINYERWRNVTAVLLVREGNGQERINENTIIADASGLIEKGKRYCEATVQHILQKVCDSPEFMKEEEKSKELLCEFFKKIVSQIQTCLDVGGGRMDDILLLGALLRGKQVIKNDEMRKEWETYEGVVKFCEDFKYNFWRLDCFCRGIANIVSNGKVIASEKLFDHMMQISDNAGYGASQGCCWENTNKNLVDPKLDVGIFYNDPEQVATKTPEQKLENTIDFIQNYYYYNRFRIVNESGSTEEIDDDDKIRRKPG